MTICNPLYNGQSRRYFSEQCHLYRSLSRIASRPSVTVEEQRCMERKRTKSCALIKWLMTMLPTTQLVPHLRSSFDGSSIHAVRSVGSETDPSSVWLYLPTGEDVQLPHVTCTVLPAGRTKRPESFWDTAELLYCATLTIFFHGSHDQRHLKHQ